MSVSIPGLVIEEPVGRGGFAVVYRARQVAMGRDVAVKVDHRVLLSDRDRRRFVREALAVGRLSGHPHVITVHDTGTLPDWRGYLVMEYCPLGSLQDLIDRSGPLPAERVLQIGVDVSGALATAHAAGILHRDIKPANLLRRDEARVVLSDFGIASLLGEDGQVSATQDGCTPAYAAPELLGHGRRTEAVDVYGLAATLYALAVGRPPHSPSSGAATAGHYLDARARPFTEIPGVPAGLSAILCRALHPDPARRPTAAALCDELALLLPDHDPRPASRVIPSTSRTARRRRGAAVVAGAAAVTLSVVVAAYLTRLPAAPTTTAGTATTGARQTQAASTTATRPTAQGSPSIPTTRVSTARTASAPTTRPATEAGADSGFASNGAAVAAAVTRVSELIGSSAAAAGDPRAGSQLLQVFLGPPAAGGAGRPLTVEFCGKAATVGSPAGPTYSYAVDAPGATPRRIARDSGFQYCMDPGGVRYTLLPTLVEAARKSGLARSATTTWMVTTNHWVPSPMWIVKLDDGERVATLTAALNGSDITVSVVPKAQAVGLPTAA